MTNMKSGQIEIVQVQPLPRHMLKLFQKFIREGAMDDTAQANHHRRTTGNPEHVEAAQGIKGK